MVRQAEGMEMQLGGCDDANVQNMGSWHSQGLDAFNANIRKLLQKQHNTIPFKKINLTLKFCAQTIQRCEIVLIVL
jgi:hypothetical protein